MNTRLINTVLSIFPDLYYRTLVRALDSSEANVVNDLCLSSSVHQYTPSGVYITMHSSIPKNYQRSMRKRYFNQEGIPQNKYQDGFIYNPVNIIQYGLTEYGYYLATKSQTHLEHAKATCLWLLKNQDVLTGQWYYSFDYSHSPSGSILKAPWASAMAQGEAISLLTRIYRVTKENELIEAAEKALRPLSVQVSDGGLCRDYCGNTFFEEYPTERPSLTLNGFMFCLFGLYDLLELNGNKGAQDLFLSGMHGLVKLLPLYDDSLMSLYDLCHITCHAENTKRNLSKKYHIIHVKQLYGLNSIAPNDTIKHYADEWRKLATIHRLGE